MRKLYRNLTVEQKRRGVIFSSCLSENRQETGTIHEVLNTATDDDRDATIDYLTTNSSTPVTTNTTSLGEASEHE